MEGKGGLNGARVTRFGMAQMQGEGDIGASSVESLTPDHNVKAHAVDLLVCNLNPSVILMN